MAVNRGKQFEEDIEKAFNNIPNFTIDRLPDPMAGFKGQRNICDYFGYIYPNAYYIECKSVHKKWFTRDDITDNQWVGLLNKSQYDGVIAGYFIWFIDYDKTIWVSAKDLDFYFTVYDRKSLNVEKLDGLNYVEIKGKKKRIRFEYDLVSFIDTIRY